MPPARRRWLIGLGMAVFTAALVLISWFWWQGHLRRELIAASLPVRPDVGRVPAEFTTRVAAAERRARQGPDEVGALAELATLYHANGFTPEAVASYRVLFQADPANPRWAHRLAGLYAGSGELDVAIALWQRVLQLAADYTPARLRLGDCLLKANRPAEAGEMYAAVLKTESTNPYALVGLARLNLQAGQPGRARERLEQAAEKSGFAIGGDLLATVCEQLGDRDRAIAIRARAKSSGAYFDPPDPWTDEIFSVCFDPFRLSVAAGVAEHSGDVGAARRLLERALELAPADGQVLLQFGMMELRMQDYASARRQLERAAAVAPQLPDVWAQLIVLHSTAGDAPAAERALASGLVHCPNSPGLRLEHGRRLAAAGRLGDAVDEYRASFQLRPEEAGPLIEIAKVLLRQERIDEGIAELRRALEVEPEYPTALTTLALFAISTGDEAAAEQWLRRVDLQVRISREDLARLRIQFNQRFGHAPRL